jgi:hypothetical protein
MATSTMRVRNHAGKVVFTRKFWSQHSYLRVRWDGRRNGRALPAGRYYVTVSGKDADGFTGISKPRLVTVSGKRLVMRTRTATVQPAKSVAILEPDGCNGCDYRPPCGAVVASTRFTAPGALSYRSGSSCVSADRWYARQAYAYYFSGDNTPRGYGTVSVSLFGGPTTPGASDQGELNYSDGTTGRVFSTGADTSDHTTAGTPVPVRRVYRGEESEMPGILWYFGTRGGADYDVATFTIRYTFLTPRP